MHAVSDRPSPVPVQAGQLIGIDLETGAPLGYRAVPGATYAGFSPPPPDGSPLLAKEFSGREIALDADILPPPIISSITPTQGILASGSTVRVTISGFNFSEVIGVAFGGKPAAYTVDSESQIGAFPAPFKTPGRRAVTVTTVAGTATAPQLYRYRACVVPNVEGKKLRKAKKRIRNADCKVGVVKRLDGATAKSGRVVRQTPPAGRIVRAGSKVHLTLSE